MCQDANCTDKEQIHTMDNIYNDIVNAMNATSRDTFDREDKKDSFRVILGWNNYAKADHDETREACILWNTNSKFRHGPVCDLITNTRVMFKHTLR